MDGCCEQRRGAVNLRGVWVGLPDTAPELWGQGVGVGVVVALRHGVRRAAVHGVEPHGEPRPARVGGRGPLCQEYGYNARDDGAAALLGGVGHNGKVHAIGTVWESEWGISPPTSLKRMEGVESWTTAAHRVAGCIRTYNHGVPVCFLPVDPSTGSFPSHRRLCDKVAGGGHVVVFLTFFFLGVICPMFFCSG